ncbi:50S ribosomal protein L34 [Candidatus Microgenomates bacterium]|nr:50S ribosomal protein L34 [Candidatus Microgenomates bacterium]
MERLTKPNPLKRKRRHGFLTRKKTRQGRAVLKRRRQKGRKRVNV